jgi:uncharacterized protein YlxW (UPF0749 family)
VRAALESQLDSVAFSQRHRRFAGRGRDNLGIARRRRNQKLAHELRAAQQRISELEAEVGAYQNQAERAEQWLHKVYTEIEDRFLQQGRSRARNATQ